MSAPKFNIPNITLSPNEGLAIVKAPRDWPIEERMLVVSSLISTLSGEQEGHRDVVEMVYNLMLLGVPEMASVTNSFTSVILKNVTPTRNDLLKWVGAGEEGVGWSDEGRKLPPLLGDVVPAAMAVTKQEAVYIALSSILFCLGKQASESAKASVVDNRPDALIRRFGIKEEDQILLPGKEAGPTRGFLETVYNAFANYTEIRTAITTFFIAIRREGHHLPINLEIMMTNFQLMRGAGMTHVDAVVRLAKAHPWTLRVPELTPFYARFLHDLEKFHEIEEDIRPYHRLLVPQSQYLFISSELRPLIAVAGSFIEDVEKTFSGYVYNKANYQKLINKVHGFAPNYRPTTGLSALATLLGVKDEPLPTISATAVRDEEETV